MHLTTQFLCTHIITQYPATELTNIHFYDCTSLQRIKQITLTIKHLTMK